jgi:hypothetical protein
MPSADFCLSSLHVAIQSAVGQAMISLITALPHNRQISPDSFQYPLEGCKNVNFLCTTAAFTLSPEPVGFVMSCQLTRRLSLFYAVSVRRLAHSPSGFLQTHPHGYALAFGSYFC